MASELDPRKKKILKVVTDDYIASAEPIGSRTIARKYDLGLSPATIRNEMADLEEEGYLEQPHTSAGRVPSERGYRYYVDALLSLDKLAPEERELIYAQMERHHQGIDEIIHQTSKILTQLTKYPALVLSPQNETAFFRHVQLVKLSENTVLVLIVTDSGYVENKVIEFSGEVSDGELERISNMLNQKLRGINIHNLRAALLKEISSELVMHESFFHETIKLLMQSISAHSGERVYIDGATKILEQPEFANLERFKPLLRVFEEEDRLYKLLSVNMQPGAKVKIGHENDETAICDCSVVTAGYEIAGRTVGVIGILGPTRMEYAKVLPIVEYTAAILSELLTQMGKAKR